MTALCLHPISGTQEQHHTINEGSKINFTVQEWTCLVSARYYLYSKKIVQAWTVYKDQQKASLWATRHPPFLSSVMWKWLWIELVLCALCCSRSNRNPLKSCKERSDSIAGSRTGRGWHETDVGRAMRGFDRYLGLLSQGDLVMGGRCQKKGRCWFIRQTIV